DQQGDPDSTLSFVRQLTKLRRSKKAIGGAPCTVLGSGSEHVLAHHYKADHNPLLFLHNLSDKSIPVEVELAPGMEELESLFRGEIGSVEDGRLRLGLDAYEFRWLGRGGKAGVNE